MAMNKKEQEMVEGLKTRLALRWTEPVKPDVPPPSLSSSFGELTKGFLFNAHSCRADIACSSAIHHSYGRDDKTTTQHPRSLYSTRLLALKAMRHEVEKELAKKLRAIDQKIEAEEAAGEGR